MKSIIPFRKGSMPCVMSSLYRNIRCYHCSCFHTDVPVGTYHQVYGHQDGAYGEGADEVRWLSIFPQKAPHRRLSTKRSVSSKLHLYDRLRTAFCLGGSTCSSIKNSRMHEPQPCRQDVRKEVESALREAFQICCLMLPGDKRQFSDGVGYNWIDTLKAITSAAVTDHQMNMPPNGFPSIHHRIRRNITIVAFSKNTSPVVIARSVPSAERGLLYC